MQQSNQQSNQRLEVAIGGLSLGICLGGSRVVAVAVQPLLQLRQLASATCKVCGSGAVVLFVLLQSLLSSHLPLPTPAAARALG